MPEAILVPRSGTRANSWETSIPNVERAITTEAGPQLFSDCHTCFISSNAIAAGAALGSGAGTTTTGATAAGAASTTAGTLTWAETEEAVSAAGAAMV